MGHSQTAADPEVTGEVEAGPGLGADRGPHPRGEEQAGRGQHSADRQAQLNSHTTIGWAGSPQDPPKGPHHQAGGG